MAIWGFTLPKVSMEFDRLLNRLYKETLQPYWEPEVVHLQERFETLPFPFKNVKRETFESPNYWSFAEMMAFLESWQAMRGYQQQQGHSPLVAIEPLLQKYWGEGQTRQVTFTFFVKLGIIL